MNNRVWRGCVFLPGVVAALAALSHAQTSVTSAAQTATLHNVQSAALDVTSIAVTGDFVQTSGSVLKPASIRALSGKFTVTGSADNSRQTTPLGTGQTTGLVSIAVTPAAPSIYVGATQQFKATGTYSNHTTRNLTDKVTWTTNPTGIATIKASGLAKGVAAGSTTVTAALGSISGFTTLTVLPVFVETGSLNEARYYHSATLLTTGLVLVAGGIGPVPGATGALSELNSAELYNPSTGTFTKTGNLNTAREQHSATLLNTGSVLITGGSGGDGELASTEIYNPATASFFQVGNLHTARYEHTATLLPDSTVLIAGGYGGGSVLATAEIYHPLARGFIYTAGEMNAARFGATATLLPNGMVLIAGGADASGPLASAELYDPTTGIFTLVPGSLNVARSGATANLLDTGSVLIADGYNYLTTGPLTSAELYNPATSAFTLTGSQTSTTWLGTATLLGNSNVLFAGSVVDTAAPEIYHPAGSFSVTSGMITQRDLQTATLLPDGDVLIAGGYSNAGASVLATAELYEPPTFAPPDLVSIVIAPANPPLTVGSSQQLVATGTFSDNSTQQLLSVIWTSSNPVAATVTSDVTNSGVVYGVADGSATISACAGTICGTTAVSVSGQ